MDASDLSARSSSTGPSRSRISSSGRRPSPPSGREHGSSSDPTLLTPVVRSKRTPIACTECRRRQVKCTGGTPQCERCEKKGVKCEYIPIHQQRLSSGGTSASQSPQGSVPLYGYPTTPSRSVPTSPVSWPQGGHSYQEYAPGVSAPPQGDWQSQYNVSPQVSSQRYTQQSAQSAPAHLGTNYPIAYQPGQSYGQAAQPVMSASHGYTQGVALGTSQNYTQGLAVPPEYRYSSASNYDAYGQSGGSAVAPNVNTGYIYPTNVEQQMLTSHVPSSSSQTAAYPGQYYQSQQPSYDVSSGSVVPETAYESWADPNDPSYTGYQGHPYP